MTSPKKIAAVRIARALMPAEEALNQAALRLLAVGTAVLTPRADGTFHPMEGQLVVERIGGLTAKIFEMLAEFSAAHKDLRALGDSHQLLMEGDIFETPPVKTPRGGTASPLSAEAA